MEDEDDSEHDEDGNEKDDVYHWQIWRQLLRRGSSGGLVRYSLSFCCLSKNQANKITANEEPASGDDPLDITAVYSPQMHWTMESRSYWPNHLKLWQPPNPRNTPTYEVGVMRYKGHVVIDTTGTPIRDFRIPLTISSKVEGLRIEAWMRIDNRLTLGDIEARMWTEGTPGVAKVPSYNRRALSKRASLARFRTGLISWVSKRGRDQWTALMDSLRTTEQRANNLATDKDLTPQQIGVYKSMGLKVGTQSEAPTHEKRGKKGRRAAEQGDTVAGSSSGRATAGPAKPVSAASREGDNLMSLEAAQTEADPETQAPEQAPEEDSDDAGSVSSSLIDPNDSRHEQPTNPQEEAVLRNALEITLDDFFSLTGQQPVIEYPGDNYFSQWGMLQQQFRSLWAARGNTGEAPRLRARGRWTGGISQFEFAEMINGVWDDD